MGKVIHLDREGSGILPYSEVEYRADLPITLGSPAIGDIYLVTKPTTTLLGLYTTYQSGLYIRDLNNGNISDWRRLNVKVKFTSSEFVIVDITDQSKQAKFDISLITTSTTEVFQYPKNGGQFIVMASDSVKTTNDILQYNSTTGLWENSQDLMVSLGSGVYWGNGDSGFYSSASNNIIVKIDDDIDWIFGTAGFYGFIGSRPGMLSRASTNTVPNLVPQRSYLTTGIGGAVNEVSQIANSIEVTRATTTGYYIYKNTNITGYVNLSASTLLTTPISGTIEYDGSKTYVTNKSTQKVIDRTSDIKLDTTTVENTTTETTVYTASVPANSWVAGNTLKMQMFGNISNTATGNDVTLRLKIGGVEIATVTTDGRRLTNTCWVAEGTAIVRSTGTTGEMAWTMNCKVDGQTRDFTCSVGTYDTTGDLDITITAEWAAANASNVFTCTGGLMEYKN